MTIETEQHNCVGEDLKQRDDLVRLVSPVG
jgi:hypothetical protein